MRTSAQNICTRKQNCCEHEAGAAGKQALEIQMQQRPLLRNLTFQFKISVHELKGNDHYLTGVAQELSQITEQEKKKKLEITKKKIRKLKNKTKTK